MLPQSLCRLTAQQISEAQLGRVPVAGWDCGLLLNLTGKLSTRRWQNSRQGTGQFCPAWPIYHHTLLRKSGRTQIHSGCISFRGILKMVEQAKRPIKHLRWYVAILICFASKLNYMDRNTLSVLKVTIQKALNFDDSGYALITATFLWTYAVAYIISGWVVDRLGSRRGFLVFVSGWSLANILHAFEIGR